MLVVGWELPAAFPTLAPTRTTNCTTPPTRLPATYAGVCLLMEFDSGRGGGWRRDGRWRYSV